MAASTMMETVVVSPVRHGLRGTNTSTSPSSRRKSAGKHTTRQRRVRQTSPNANGSANAPCATGAAPGRKRDEPARAAAAAAAPGPGPSPATTMDGGKPHASGGAGGSGSGPGRARRLSSPGEERNILKVVLGDLLFETWYGSFYPDELVVGGNIHGHAQGLSLGKAAAAGGGGGEVVLGRLYVCRWCFRYSRELMPFMAHVKMCPEKEAGPPGRMIYSHEAYSIYEVDGEEHKLFCQNLSLFAKLFLDNKSVCFDLSAFKYYLLVQTAPTPDQQRQVVGFFSKEKMSWDNNNLACILVFPPWQRKGLGKILMGVSYELSKREERIGGPEKPLSDLGRRGYLSFWATAVARQILAAPLRKAVTINDISQNTFILPDDIVAALKEMDVLHPKKRAAESAVVSKARVRDWARANRVNLAPAVDAAGFVEEIADEEEEEEGEVDDEMES